MYSRQLTFITPTSNTYADPIIHKESIWLPPNQHHPLPPYDRCHASQVIQPRVNNSSLASSTKQYGKQSPQTSPTSSSSLFIQFTAHQTQPKWRRLIVACVWQTTDDHPKTTSKRRSKIAEKPTIPYFTHHQNQPNRKVSYHNHRRKKPATRDHHQQVRQL